MRPLLSGFALLATLFHATSAGAQVFESFGTRALGMGGAFVAVADDATATYWNPAGLATGPSLSGCLERTEADTVRPRDAPFPAGARHSSTASCMAVRSWGFSYSTLRSNQVIGTLASTDEEADSRQDLRRGEVRTSSLVSHHVGITLVQALLDGVFLGATVGVVRATAASGVAAGDETAAERLAGAADLQGRSHTTIDLAAGVMASFGPARLGLVVRNVRQPDFETPDGDVLTLHRQVRAGLAITPGRSARSAAYRRGLVLAVDADLTTTPTPEGGRRVVALGLEHWLFSERLGLRAGARAHTLGAARPVATAGISVATTARVFIDAHVVGGHRDGDHGWGIGVRVGF